MAYRPQPKRRSYIPKPGSPKGRPLGISCFEDELVEEAVKRVLKPVYEPVFQESSHGYRPEKNQHGCLDELGRTIQQKKGILFKWLNRKSQRRAYTWEGFEQALRGCEFIPGPSQTAEMRAGRGESPQP